jgi:hypothetical protein
MPSDIKGLKPLLTRFSRPILLEKGICGKRFFALTMTELHELGGSGLQLSYGEKRKLLYNIKAILPYENTHISVSSMI